jgi:hypothetical protein
MKFLILCLVWLVLLAVSWPLALLALVLVPVLALLAIPFALVGIVVAAVLAFVKAILFLPARILGFR